MSTFDSARIAALAAQLDVSPRALLVLAGRIAATPEMPLDAMRLNTELARLRAAPKAVGAAAGLALLGYQDYAKDDLDRALQILWAQPRAQGT